MEAVPAFVERDTRIILERLNALEGTMLAGQTELRGAIVSNQEAIDAMAARLNSAADNIGAALADVRGDIQTLKAQGVDTTALEASVGRIEAGTSDLGALAAENPPAGP